MVKKIALAVFIAFFISFSSFFILFQIFPNPTADPNHPFLIQKFPENEEEIFIFGSSEAGRLDARIINDQISNTYPELHVYNLAYGSDFPKKRIQTLDKIIEINPKVVVYGISYRDFEVSNFESKEPLPNLKNQFDEILIKNTPGEEINPQFFTLRNIRDNLRFTGLFPEHPYFHVQDTPYFEYDKEAMKIIPSEEFSPKITNQSKYYFGELSNNYQLQAFLDILDSFKENNISVLVYLSPLHQSYLDENSEEDEETFDLILEQIRERDVKILDLRSKYTDLNIWTDPHHIAFNKTASIFSTDVADFIIKEVTD